MKKYRSIILIIFVTISYFAGKYFMPSLDNSLEEQSLSLFVGTLAVFSITFILFFSIAIIIDIFKTNK